MFILVSLQHSIQQTWTLTKADKEERFEIEMWIWRIVKISWMDKISNEEVLAEVNETRTTFTFYLDQETSLDRNVFRHDQLLCNLVEGRMIGNLREAEGYKC